MYHNLAKVYHTMTKNTGKTFTPKQVAKMAGVDRPSQYMWALKQHGCTIEVLKNGRNVLGYKIVTAPETTPQDILEQEKKVAEKTGRDIFGRFLKKTA